MIRFRLGCHISNKMSIVSSKKWKLCLLKINLLEMTSHFCHQFFKTTYFQIQFLKIELGKTKIKTIWQNLWTILCRQWSKWNFHKNVICNRCHNLSRNFMTFCPKWQIFNFSNSKNNSSSNKRISWWTNFCNNKTTNSSSNNNFNSKFNSCKICKTSLIKINKIKTTKDKKDEKPCMYNFLCHFL